MLMDYWKWTLPLTMLLTTETVLADDWWGQDKALHFTISFGIGSAGYALAVPVTEHREYRALSGIGAGFAIGAAKEGYDASGAGDPSWRDFAWDVAGTAVGVLMAYAVDHLVTTALVAPGGDASRAPSALLIAF